MKSIIRALTVLTSMLLAGFGHTGPEAAIPSSSPQQRPRVSAAQPVSLTGAEHAVASSVAAALAQAITPAEKQLAHEMTCKIARVLAVAPKVTPSMRTFAMSDEFKRLKDSLGRKSLAKAFESARNAIDQGAPLMVVTGGQTSAIEACVYYELEECRDVRIKLDAIQNLSGCGGELWGDLSEAEKASRAKPRGAKH